ncbi:MAG TPA: substrate-binding domain-containing protein [Acidimicrobiales bacterium]|nr:substrate-binding domain-containing protein [Acidimicrobiales bacterium]
MTRYLDVSTEIARQVDSGQLQAGRELSSVRAFADERQTTPSTISRAYRHLAQAGVIILGERRRATVAPDGLLAARRLLGTQQVFRLAGSDDPALDIVLRRAGRGIVAVGTRGSFQGLTALWRGSADGAAIHLLHHSGVYNAPFASALLRGRQPTLIHLWRREQGLLVPPGNPLKVQSPEDLGELRVAKREFGAGTRALLDRLLNDSGIASDSVAGPEAGSHLEVGLAIASGMADVGLGVRAVAVALALEFIPLVWEEYDVVLSAESLGAAGPLIDVLRDKAARASIAELGGYDTKRAGTVRNLD